MVREVQSVEEFDQILKEAGDKLVVVDFTAAWCGPCKYIGPKFVTMSEMPENKNVVFLKVDVDNAGELTQKYKVRCMPTFMFFKNGTKVDDFSGADEQKLGQKIAALRT